MLKIPVIISNSRIKTIWNIIVVFAVLIFSIAFSYRYTFQVYKCDLLYWGLLLIFALDVLVNFNSTVKIEHAVSDDRKTIAVHYLKGWFTVDFITAFPFDFILLLAIGFPDEHDGRHLYFIVLQLITLAKLLKVKKITGELQQYLRINPGVMRLLDFAFWFTQAVHYIALGWIVIGAAEAARVPLDRYIRALYWSVTTVATIGYGDYYPDHDSNVQIIFTIIVQVFGVGMYGYIIGNVSGLIANLDVARAEFIKKIESVRIYLSNKDIPKELQDKILSYYHYIWDKKKNVSDENPLSDLPLSLSLEIMLYLNRDMLMKVDFFKNAEDLFVREAIQMLKPLIYLPEDYIIRQGEYGDCMYFLSSGEIEVLVNDKQVAKLGPGSTFGETSLLIGEKRSASIHTLTHCEVYRLSKSDFDSLRIRFPEFNDEMEEISRQRGLIK
ncbi:MAG TPA: cyclic nucleotide-binding domain-containing protein [Spirochaetota bacterium]|nr:cyclic nucleotide-binding domain-containing protein [Spirochaetota bacterium]HPF06107.1 cyclic nucleotide-binding domain-containing protein [Spirochaetota bacterium]HPJ43112.1 cyclic nucleotide-binding domain-containing protein [Spirochaetota bacterium]HPR37209.1 cyclic nucleotide-binding domain-containing protein [Spirochaetota bacterium]